MSTIREGSYHAQSQRVTLCAQALIVRLQVDSIAITPSGQDDWRSIPVRSASFRLRFDKHGPWTQKWDNTDHILLQIKIIYETQAELSPWTLKALFERLFTAYREMADWLWEDTDTGLDQAAVMNYVYGDPILRICDALAQTCKHLRRNPTRRQPDPLTAWLSEVGDRAHAIVSWENEDRTLLGECDALQLALQVSDAWWRFFEQRGLVSDSGVMAGDPPDTE